MDSALKIVTEKHSEAVRELIEHLDGRADSKALELLDSVLEYDVMLVTVLNDRLRKYYGKQTERIHSPSASH